MKYIHPFVIVSFLSMFSFAQCIVNVNDTLLCHPGDPMFISPNISGNCKTLSYEINTIPFQEYTLSQPYSIFMTDDDVVGPFAIGFDFKFFGNTYNQFFLGSNGWISFSAGQTISFTPKPLPSNDNVPLNVIMGPWEDWDPSQIGVISFETIGQAPNRKLVVDFDVLGHYNCGVDPSVLGDFQIVLNEQDFIIENHLKNKPSCDTTKAVQGIQNIDGTKAVVVNGRNATNWSSYYESVQYKPNNQSYYSWELGSDILSNNPTSVFTPQETTIYSLYYTDVAGCTASVQFEIYIPTPLDPLIQRVGNQLHASLSGYFYQWYLNGQPLIGETFQITTLGSFGLYTVEVTDLSTGCSYMSRVHLYASSLGVKDLMGKEIDIYPNPTRGQLMFDFGNFQEKLQINLYDIHGHLLEAYSADKSHHKTFNLATGLYFIKFSDLLGHTITKIITIN
ncbi:MAG: hypothetical protein CMP66_01590 [Flavobacteriales bacterium]|nr:hypothetical protein [Flavobacteriales bacterium]